MKIKSVRKEYLSLLYFTGPFLLLGGYGIRDAGNWAVILAAGGLALPALWLYGYFLGRVSCTLPLRLFAGVTAVPLSFFSMTTFAQFVHTCVLTESSLWLIPIPLLIMAIWAGVRGLQTTTGFARLIGPVVIFFFIMVIISAILKIEAHIIPPEIPFEQKNFGEMILPFWTLYVLQGIVLFTVLSEEKDVFRETFPGLLLSIFITAGSLLTAALALGIPVFEALAFPVYYPPGLARDTEYLERMEILWLAILFFTEFAKQAVLFTAIRKIFKP